jgi:hypothetical protein
MRYAGAGRKGSEQPFPYALKPHRNRVWLCLVSLLVIVGSVGSVFGASAVAHNALVSGNQQFATSSADIAADLQLSIQHEMDLVVSAQAFVLDNPNASEMQFVQWAQR